MNLRFPGLICYILDDEEDVRRVLAIRLTRLGAISKEHDTLSGLMDSVALASPDVIFLDVAIGPSDAIKAVRELSAAGYRGYVQIISGIGEGKLADIHAVCESYGYGALYPLAKPFGRQAIEATLKAVAELKIWAAANTSVDQLEIGFALTRRAHDGSVDGVLAMPHRLPQDMPPRAERSPATLANAALGWSSRLGINRPFALRMHMRFAQSAEAMETGDLRTLIRFDGIAPMFVVAQPDIRANWRDVRELRTRLGVYGVRLGVLMPSLSEAMLSVIDRALCDEIIVGEQLIMQVASTDGRNGIADEMAARVRSAAIDLHALGGDVAARRNVMGRLGVKLISPSLMQFQAEEDFDLSLTDDPPETHTVAALPIVDELPNFERKSLLSSRELQVIHFIVQGKSSKEIALELELSPRTVDVHRSRILAKLGRRNAAELVALVHKRGS